MFRGRFETFQQTTRVRIPYLKLPRRAGAKHHFARNAKYCIRKVVAGLSIFSSLSFVAFHR